ncbi:MULTISPECIES: hypothetical protein [unclassified Streptomyces]|uniref:hypothetical protein n=1 Tax=unclassified Streptomyces TaxID=2593676 RepID=UPI002E8182C2|nr:hypothetical protein [Streptomyces sp. NBC_00589]WTI37105.1 hypothetical protein OIC96_19850 [Streptomyces sp. NBC_00775]WUB29219.1 hypothetical protein OHA51_29885 [Streptomyces sp. NBC_00589]
MRHARFYGRGKELIVRDRQSRERRYTVGEGGIVRAVFVPPADSGTAVKGPSADRWGVVDFEGADEKTILQVPLAEWLPEAGVVGLLHLSPSQCLDRTGLRRLVTDLGIPLKESPEPGQRSEDQPSAARPDHAVHRDLPAWHNWARGIGMLVWFVSFLVVPMTGNGSAWTALVASAALLLVPGADLVVRLAQRSRGRKDTSLAGAEIVVPDPEAGGGATRRFCGTAAVRVLPRDVVLTDTLGAERWIPRGGVYGVSKLVRLTHPTSGAVLGVEFRDGANASRALLPWAWWFAGPQGQEAWSKLVTALGVPVSDEKVRHAQKADTWWQNHELAADARRMSPMDAKEARTETSWHSSVIGGGEPIIVPVFAALLLPQLVSDDWPSRVAGVLAALTVVAELAPVVAHQLTARLNLDRPAAPESP